MSCGSSVLKLYGSPQNSSVSHKGLTSRSVESLAVGNALESTLWELSVACCVFLFGSSTVWSDSPYDDMTYMGAQPSFSVASHPLHFYGQDFG